MKRLNLISVIFFLGCSTLSSNFNFDKATDFNAYKYYELAVANPDRVISQPEYDNAENRAIIDEAIRHELSKIGFSENKGAADLLVQYDILITEMVDPRFDSAALYKPWVGPQVDTFNYTEGLLVVRLIDIEKGKLVWQGSMSGIINGKPNRFDNKLKSYIAKLFVSLAELKQ